MRVRSTMANKVSRELTNGRHLIAPNFLLTSISLIEKRTRREGQTQKLVGFHLESDRHHFVLSVRDGRRKALLPLSLISPTGLFFLFFNITDLIPFDCRCQPSL